MSISAGWPAGRVAILDGAVGTELERRGVATDGPLWSAAAVRSAADCVRAVHEEYAAAGAELIVANTFRANPRALRRVGLDGEGARLCAAAVRLAQEGAAAGWRRSARAGRVAASVGPVEDCYRPDLTPPRAELEAEHRVLASWLRAAGAELLWIETLATVREAAAAASAAAEIGLPFVVSFVLGEDGRLLGGEALAEGVAAVSPFGPAALGLNCIPPSGLTRHLPRLCDLSDGPLAAYAHIGNERPLPGWGLAESRTPEEYGRDAAGWVAAGARIIGGCCGTTPAHIRALSGLGL